MFETLPEKAWGNPRNICSLWGPLTPKPLDRMNPKSVRYNYIHPWACLRNFVPIAQCLRGVMSRRTHSPRSGRRKTKTKQDLNAFARNSGRYCCFFVFQQMTLIWPFKVTKGKTDNAIWFAKYHFQYVFHSNYSAISHETLFFSIRPQTGLSRSPSLASFANFQNLLVLRVLQV